MRKLEGKNWPLVRLAAVRDLRAYLLRVEREAILTARGLGDSVEDIAGSLGISRERAEQLVRSVEAAAGQAEAEGGTIVLPDLESKKTEQ